MDPLTPLVANLQADGRLRVWSLVITAFGDLVQHRGGVISTARLGDLLGRVGVEPGALRTALSRLGQDGWVTSEREGRLSHYRLSDEGVREFAPATSLIYAPPRCEPVSDWALVIRLGSDPVLCPADETPDDADCCVVGALRHLSPAFRESLVQSQYLEALKRLASDIGAIDAGHFSPATAAAARLLLVHRWRRIVLRHRELPAELMPPTEPLRNPRIDVARAYAQLAPLAEAWLDGEETTLPPMPAGDASFDQRFREAKA